MTKKRLSTLAAGFVALGLLAGCTNSFQANVTRFHEALPPPAQGESFAVVPNDARDAGSLEFAHYADLVAEELTALGYNRAADPASAALVVSLDYGVDKGRERVVTSRMRSAFYSMPTAYPVIYTYRGRDGEPRRAVRYVYGYRDPFLWGFNDPFYNDVDSYTVYQSQLKLSIDKVDGGRVFEGTATAQSLSNKLTYLVPNLIDAVFKDFPGTNGEDVRVTIPPEERGK